MEYEKKYNNLTLFKNAKGGEPMYKDKEAIRNKDGDLVLIPEFSGVLKIEVPLPVGEYEVKLREKYGKKSGALYYWGGIKPKDKQYGQSQHYQDKANGYQRQSTIGLVKQPDDNLEPIIDDEIPF